MFFNTREGLAAKDSADHNWQTWNAKEREPEKLRQRLLLILFGTTVLAVLSASSKDVRDVGRLHGALQAICSDALVDEGGKSADHDLLLISEEVSLQTSVRRAFEITSLV